MSPDRLASIVIDNYNYGRFLGEAIESALAQTYPHVEVIVVDDGSTDDSRDVIIRYGSRVTPVLKENGGQASAFNAGFDQASGDAIYLLDADDRLRRDAVERTVGFFDEPSVAKVHWRYREIDEEGVELPTRHQELSSGDLREYVCENGPGSHSWAPTSANAFARAALEGIVPIPEAEFLVAADTYLCQLAPFVGAIRSVDEMLTDYRQHRSLYKTRTAEERLVELRRMSEPITAAAKRWCAARGAVDDERWLAHSWPHQVLASLAELDAIIGPGAPFLLADQDEWGIRPGPARHPIPFPNRGGVYWGSPASDEEAIEALERGRAAGAKYLVVAAPCSWWFSHYRGFDRHLRRHYPSVCTTDYIQIFAVSGTARGHQPDPERGD